MIFLSRFLKLTTPWMPFFKKIALKFCHSVFHTYDWWTHQRHDLQDVQGESFHQTSMQSDVNKYCYTLSIDRFLSERVYTRYGRAVFGEQHQAFSVENNLSYDCKKSVWEDILTYLCK